MNVPDPFIPEWLSIAIRELGVSEVFGAKNNPKIVEYHSFTSLKASDDETNWCSSFVCFCVEKSGFKSTRLANAQSWLKWGSPISKPCYGCIVVLKRGKEAWMGHVGFVVGEGKDHILVLAGNQGNKVSVAKFKKIDVLGYRFV